jgi:hypothetical protein
MWLSVFTCYHILKASRLLYLLLCLPANISSEPVNVVTHKNQFDACDNPPLDGFNSDEDMSLGGATRKSGQSGFSNSSSLQTAMSRNKSQEVSGSWVWIIVMFVCTQELNITTASTLAEKRRENAP